MSLFQLYETERKPFTVGKKWICVDPSLLGFDGTMLNQVVQIIDFMYTVNGQPVQTVRYEVLTGRYYKGGRYRCRLDMFKQCFKPFKPYTMEIMSNA
jgi:hypothetical protein